MKKKYVENIKKYVENMKKYQGTVKKYSDNVTFRGKNVELLKNSELSPYTWALVTSHSGQCILRDDVTNSELCPCM